MKWSKLILIDLTLMLHVCCCLLCGNHYDHNISIIYCYTNFTTSPLKIDEPSSTFQLCHSWIGTFGNWYKFLIVGSLNVRFKWCPASRRKTYRYHKLRKTFSKFYRRYYDLISKFQVGLKSLLRQGLSEPDFYGDLVYKLKKIVGSNNFSAQFIKIISHYKKIGYNINVLQQTACLVVNPITVGNFAFLFNCTPVGRTSDSMMVPT